MRLRPLRSETCAAGARTVPTARLRFAQEALEHDVAGAQLLA